jgi:hypothetical protein
MPGINLSQSAMQNEQIRSASEKKWFGPGFIWSMVLLLLLVAIWGGLVFYERRLQTDIAAIVASTDQNKKGFSGGDVDTVADFSLRFGLITRNLEKKVDPAKNLAFLEGVILDSVVLSSYSYNQAGRAIAISGVADSFRGLTQQLVALRTLPDFSGLSVGNSRRTEGGKIDFSVSIALQ